VELCQQRKIAHCDFVLLLLLGISLCIENVTVCILYILYVLYMCVY